MGAKQTIAALELQIEVFKDREKLINDIVAFIRTVAEIPTDGIICYTQQGMQIQCDVVNGAKMFLERLQREQS